METARGHQVPWRSIKQEGESSALSLALLWGNPYGDTVHSANLKNIGDPLGL